MAFDERGFAGFGLFHMARRTFQGKVNREDFLDALDRRLKEKGYVQKPDSPWLRYGFDQSYLAPKPYDGFFTGVEVLVKVDEQDAEKVSINLCPITVRAWPWIALGPSLLLFAVLYLLSMYLVYGDPRNWPSTWLMGALPILVAVISLLLGIYYYLKIIGNRYSVGDLTGSIVNGLAKNLGLTPLRKWSEVQLLKKDAIKQWVLGRRVGKFPYKTVTDSEAVRLTLVNPILSAIQLKKEGKVTRAKWSYVFGVLQAAVDLIFVAALLFATRRFFYGIAYLISLPILVRMSTLYFTTRITLYKCVKCGRTVLETAKTCPKCGTQL